jgi:hypothetical protein
MSNEIIKLKCHYVSNLLRIGVHTMKGSPCPRVMRHFQKILNQIHELEKR